MVLVSYSSELPGLGGNPLLGCIHMCLSPCDMTLYYSLLSMRTCTVLLQS